MPVEFYFHTPVTHSSEMASLYELARQLERSDFFALDNNFLTVIANIDPSKDSRLKDLQLPQVDALLITNNFVTLLDFKNISVPFFAYRNKKWFFKQADGRTVHIKAGSSTNPYKQIRHIRNNWKKYLIAQTNSLNEIDMSVWNYMSSAVVFYPHLHPDANFDQCQPDAWLRFVGIDNFLLQYLLPQINTMNPHIQLNEANIRTVADVILGANGQKWEWKSANRRRRGKLEIKRFQNQDRDPQPHYIYDGVPLRIGRNREANDIVIESGFKKVSNKHGYILAQDDAIYIYDLKSTNGTFICNKQGTSKRVPADGAKLREGDEIWLGTSADEEEERRKVGILYFSYDLTMTSGGVVTELG